MFAVALLLFCAGALWYNGQSWRLQCGAIGCELQRTTLGVTTTMENFRLLEAEEHRVRLRLVTVNGTLSLPGGHVADMVGIRSYLSGARSDYRAAYRFVSDPVFWLLVELPLTIAGYFFFRSVLLNRASGRAMHTVDRYTRIFLDVLVLGLGVLTGLAFVGMSLYMISLAISRSEPWQWDDVLTFLFLGLGPLALGVWLLHGIWKYVQDMKRAPVEQTHKRRRRLRKYIETLRVALSVGRRAMD